MKQLYSNNPKIGFIIIFLTLMAFMFLEMRNHRFSLVDYEVYYKSAQRVYNGENLYNSADGHYQYKYSPVAAVYFIPFLSVPLQASKYIYWTLSALFICLLLFINLKLVYLNMSPKPSTVNTITLLSGAFLAVHFMLDIHLGQVNFLLFLTYSLIALLFIKNKHLLWPLFLAVSIFIKPFALIFLPYFLLKKKFKQMGLFLTYILILTTIPLLFYNVSELWHQYNGWFSQLFIEVKNKQSLLACANHTIFSVLVRYTPLKHLHFSTSGLVMYQTFIVSGIVLFVLWFIHRGKAYKCREVADFALLTAIIPLLAFTDINSFGAVSLMICILLAHFRSMKIVGKVITILGITLCSFNIYDLWGSELFTLLKNISVVSFGTIFLIISLSIIRKQQIV